MGVEKERWREAKKQKKRKEKKKAIAKWKCVTLSDLKMWVLTFYRR